MQHHNSTESQFNTILNPVHTGQQRGTLLSYTTLYDVPSSHSAQAPLHFALVRLEDGAQILAQLTDVEDISQISIGDEVEMVTRILTTEGARGVIVYGYKFRPILMSV